MITDRPKFTIKIPSTGCLVSILPLESIQNHFSGMYAPYKKCTYPNFQQLPMSDIWLTMFATVLPGWRTWKKSRMNRKLKISNTADNAGITQSQARDTRHRWMQEVNSLCADSLRAEYCIVFIPPDTAILLLLEHPVDYSHHFVRNWKHIYSGNHTQTLF